MRVNPANVTHLSRVCDSSRPPRAPLIPPALRRQLAQPSPSTAASYRRAPPPAPPHGFLLSVFPPPARLDQPVRPAAASGRPARLAPWRRLCATYFTHFHGANSPKRRTAHVTTSSSRDSSTRSSRGSLSPVTRLAAGLRHIKLAFTHRVNTLNTKSHAKESTGW